MSVSSQTDRKGWLGQPQMLYQGPYVWLVFLSALDVMMTWVVLHWGGSEVNGLADAVIRRFGLTGIVLFKYALVVLFICICESVGRRNFKAGRRLAYSSIAITCIPVTIAFVQLLIWG